MAERYRLELLSLADGQPQSSSASRVTAGALGFLAHSMSVPLLATYFRDHAAQKA